MSIACIFPELHPILESDHVATPTIPGLAPISRRDDLLSVSPLGARLTLSLEQVSAEDLLRYVTSLANYRPTVVPGAIPTLENILLNSGVNF